MSQNTSSETRKTRDEMNRFFGKYMKNVKLEQDEGVPLEVVSNGNCFFASILYHLARGSINSTHEDHIALRQASFDCINNMNLSKDIELNGIGHAEFEKQYMEERISEDGQSMYHYPDTLTISCMANQFNMHIVILDDVNKGAVTIIPFSSKGNVELENTGDPDYGTGDGNYFVIRRESGVHYRPYTYENKGSPQLLLENVLNLLNDEIQKANTKDVDVIQAVEAAVGVRHYSIEWKDIISEIEVPLSSIASHSHDDKKAPNNNTSTKTQKKNKPSSKTQKKNKPNKTRKSEREIRKSGHFPDVKYCWYGCDDHILVWLYDALIVFIETLGKS